MTAKVEQLQSEWRHLVELSQSEDVILTSSGQAVARLIGVKNSKKAVERREWLKDLAGLRQSTSCGKPGPSSEAILDDLRADRD